MNFQTHNDYQRYFEHQKYQLFQPYIHHQSSFIPRLLPEFALQLSTKQVAYLLEKRFSVRFWEAMNPEQQVASPTQYQPDGQWLKRSNIVGINVRTIGNFWNIIKYSFTLPSSYDSVHLLPIWECGVVASLYGMASWNINPEFYSHELAAEYPHLDTVEKQLRAVINILHLQGRSVGMDIIPHTDRYSEIVLANPQYFEWLQRADLSIVNHDENLYLIVQQAIMDWLLLNGSVLQTEYLPNNIHSFFNESMPESERLRMLFGERWDLDGRTKRRNSLIQYLYDRGYEPAPATMGPPYRGLAVDTSESAKVVDQDGRVWRDYVITKPQKFSRAFGPLTRYKLHEALDENHDWAIDFSKPRPEVYEYVSRRYAECALYFNFDYMRGDMAHVQMRVSVAPDDIDSYYDIHKYIKNFVQNTKPSFAYYAESFLAPDGEMAYGSEADHLERSEAEVSLGDLQSMVVGEAEFMNAFQHYSQLHDTRRFTPCFTIMTADKDDPRFDLFYAKGNQLRAFMGFFLVDWPSYTGLGFECRDLHTAPAPNEHYTKLYVFRINEGDKATFGPYTFGQNVLLFNDLLSLKNMSESLLSELRSSSVTWLEKIQDKANVIAWRCDAAPEYTFVVNLDLEKMNNIPTFVKDDELWFSTIENNTTQLMGGECRIYKKRIENMSFQS